MKLYADRRKCAGRRSAGKPFADSGSDKNRGDGGEQAVGQFIGNRQILDDVWTPKDGVMKRIGVYGRLAINLPNTAKSLAMESAAFCSMAR